ncbi:hypothetical protein V8C37DRAFT_2814 [Trichoderma ceciliae]
MACRKLATQSANPHTCTHCIRNVRCEIYPRALLCCLVLILVWALRTWHPNMLNLHLISLFWLRQPRQIANENFFFFFFFYILRWRINLCIIDWTSLSTKHI